MQAIDAPYYEVPGVKPERFPRTLEKRSMPFSGDEYRARLARVQDIMRRKRLDIVVVTDPSNICYLTGYAATSSYVAQGLIFTAGQTLPEFFLRRQDAPAAMYMTILPNDRIHGYPEYYIGNRDTCGFDVIFQAISELATGKEIGVELGSMTAASFAKIKRRFDHFNFLDVCDDIAEYRLIKSPKEQRYMLEAGQLTEAVARQLGTFFSVGRCESEIAADISSALLKGLPGQPGEPADYLLMPGGKQTGTSHVTWTDQKAELGKHYNVEFAASRHRYQAPIMRTVSVGTPNEELVSLYDAVRTGCEAALAAVKPGATCADVAIAYCLVLDKAGYWKDSRCGYPIGINWMEPSCSLRVDDPTVLEPGMAFHLMLGTWLKEDFGCVLSESFLVTETGYSLLYDVSRDLVVV